MTTRTHSLKFRKQRRFLMVLPLITLPFITMAFWALGGGTAEEDTVDVNGSGGLITQLPEAKLRDENSLNKMSFYEQAALDSIRRKELMKIDPYYDLQFDSAQPGQPTMLPAEVLKSRSGTSRTIANSSGTPTTGIKTFSDPNEEKVFRKLAELDRALNEASNENQKSIPAPGMIKTEDPEENFTDVTRLDSAMEQLPAEDPELNQLNVMLEKILDIQHPDRLAQKIKESSVQSKRQVFPVTLKAEDDYSSILISSPQSIADTLRRRPVHSERFYSLDEPGENAITQNTIQAVIHQTQSIVPGASIKIRTLNDMYVQGLLIPKGSFLSGISALVNERLHLSVTTIHYQHSILPVNLVAYDLEGLQGIYIPGTISNDFKNEAADQALQSIAAGSLYPSAANQAATAGIQAAKTLLTKKTKVIKMELKAGYRLLLVNKDVVE